MTARQLATPASERDREFGTGLRRTRSAIDRSIGAVGKVAFAVSDTIRREAKSESVGARSTELSGGVARGTRRRKRGGAGAVTHSASTASSGASPSAPGPPSRRCGRGGARRRISKWSTFSREKRRVSNVRRRGLGIDGLPGNVRAPGAGRRGARAHLCAALTLTVADPFLPGRRVDTSAPRDLFLSCSFMGKNNEQTSMVGRATGALGPPSLRRARGLSASS